MVNSRRFYVYFWSLIQITGRLEENIFVNRPYFLAGKKILYISEICKLLADTVKPVNTGHRRERQYMAFIDKWSYMEVILFYFFKEWLLKCGFYLEGGLYSEVTLSTGLTVNIRLVFNV